MEFPTQELLFSSMEEFGTATPQEPHDFGIKLLAQMRGSGRILDHHRIVLGGDRMQTVLVPMTKMFPTPSLSNWRFKFQFWPRDASIRRNMCTSIWVDISSILGSREGIVVDAADNTVPQEAVLGELEAAGAVAAVRWAVVIGEDARMRLHLQTLPATADSLTGKPAFRG